LDELLTERGWSLRKLHELTGISLSSLSDTKNHKHTPNPKELSVLLETFGLAKESDFFKEGDERN
jgi:transcriptional regulator with XRE-family HTH domain